MQEDSSIVWNIKLICLQIDMLWRYYYVNNVGQSTIIIRDQIFFNAQLAIDGQF
jgi:hypothetical protein